MKQLMLVATALVATSVHADPITWIQAIVPSIITVLSREDKFDKTSSVTVTAIGKGKTCEQALENAKVTAIEKAVGVWMSGEKTVDQDVYKERIVEYSGGLIKSYKVIRNECTTIEIQAEVVSRSNKINTNSANVTQETRDHLKAKIENEKKRNLAIKEVNNRSKAIAFDIKNIEFQLDKMVIVGEMYFQEKWKHDYNDLRTQTDNFILDSFHNRIHLNVKGYNLGKEVFNKRYQLDYDGVDLYHVHDSGKVAIYPNRRDMIKLTFPVDSSRIINVDKFQVSIL
jgi:hypothetical protein